MVLIKTITMKTLSNIFLITIFMLTGCNRCGKDIKLGDFELMPKNKTGLTDYIG
jgi:uncharacterized membrane protein